MQPDNKPPFSLILVIIALWTKYKGCFIVTSKMGFKLTLSPLLLSQPANTRGPRCLLTCSLYRRCFCHIITHTDMQRVQGAHTAHTAYNYHLVIAIYQELLWSGARYTCCRLCCIIRAWEMTRLFIGTIYPLVAIVHGWNRQPWSELDRQTGWSISAWVCFFSRFSVSSFLEMAFTGQLSGCFKHFVQFLIMMQREERVNILL